VKYGSTTDADAGTIGLTIEGDRIRVRAQNRVESPEDARRVEELIESLARDDVNVRDLYLQRLTELFQDPSLPRAQLGLLRMAFEGGFRLSCRLGAGELEITAERPCDAAH